MLFLPCLKPLRPVVGASISVIIVVVVLQAMQLVGVVGPDKQMVELVGGGEVGGAVSPCCTSSDIATGQELFKFVIFKHVRCIEK